MAPPGRPKMTSVCSISRLLIRACAPVNCIGASLSSRWLLSNWLAKQNDLPSGRPFDAHVFGERVRQVSTTEIRIVALADSVGYCRARRRNCHAAHLATARLLLQLIAARLPYGGGFALPARR